MEERDGISDDGISHYMTQDAATRAEELARVAYGRLLAILAAKDGDIE